MRGLVLPGWHAQKPAEFAHGGESLAVHPGGEAVEEHACVFGAVP